MLPLEDNYGDIIGKAMRGLGLPDEELARLAGLSVSEVGAARRGEFAAASARKLAGPLRLNPAALAAIGAGAWHPHAAGIVGLQQLTSAFGRGMTVNCYVVWNAGGDAALFDTGTQPAAVLDFLDAKKLALRHIFITHSHGDHLDCLPQIQIATGAPAHIHRHGDIGGARLFDWGAEFQLGPLSVSARQTTGHAADGTTFIVSGLEKTVAIVGDALFAGSMGGGLDSYREALALNLKNIYALPDDTLLCPGHGPLTTVALEKTHNPFYQPL